MITIHDVEAMLAHFREIGVSINEKREGLIRRDTARLLAAETAGRQVAILQEDQAGYDGVIYFFYRALEGEVLARHPGLLKNPENWPISQLPNAKTKGFGHRLSTRRNYLLAGEVNLNAVVIDCGTEAEKAIQADLEEIGLTGAHPY